MQKAEALEKLRTNAEAGDGTAMCNLGVAYEHGKGGLPKDQAKAVQWYRKGAEAGDVVAQAEVKARQQAEEDALQAELARRRAEEERQEPLRPGRVFRDAPWAPEMVVIPAGRFMMGSPKDEPERTEDESPQHEVTIARPYAMGRYAVTFAEYEVYAKAKGQAVPGDRGWGRGRRPVINVSWEDAQEYVQWLNEQLKLDGSKGKYRLPSDAEWEYAARAGAKTAFWWGDKIDPSQANYDGRQAYNGGAKGEYREQTVPVDSFKPNAFGLHCVHGNVWEWVQDRWHGNYQGAPVDGSEWQDAAAGAEAPRVLRGGAWLIYPGGILRAADRSRGTPGDGGDGTGFRIARTLLTL
jgi:formylglycine-generating enzyme required for sulfatase activity